MSNLLWHGRENGVCWLLIVIAALLLVLPMWLRGCPDGHDILHHLIFSHHFTTQFWQGELYPRWLTQMNAGFGSPTFFFYAPLPFWITALLSAPFWIDQVTGYPLILAASLALLASGISAYYWLRALTCRRYACPLALLYMALPYHLLIDLYMRFAFAEFWSFVWVPLIFLGLRQLMQAQASGRLLLPMALALQVMTHLPTFITLLPVLGGYALLLTRRSAWRRLLTALLAMLLGVLLSAIYWLPAMTTQHYVSMPSMYVGFLYYANSFLDSWPSLALGFTFRRYLTFALTLTAALAASVWLARRYAPEWRAERNFWLGSLLFVLFMMFPVSKPLWDLLPVLQKIQFPWRFGTLLTFASLSLIAVSLNGKPRTRQRRTARMASYLAGMILLLLLGSEALVGFRPAFLQPVSHAMIYKTLQLARSPLEYRPRDVPPELFSKTMLGDFSRRTPWVSSPSTTLGWQQRTWQGRRIRLQISTPEATVLTLHHFYYPGWQASNSEGKPLSVTPSAEGLLQVALPAGDYVLTLQLLPLPVERAGLMLSLLGLLSWLLWLILGRRRHKAAETS